MQAKKSRKKEYSKIKSLNDIRRNKKNVETKLKVRKVLMKRHLRDLNEDFSGDYVFKQSLKALKIDKPLFQYIPGLAKGVKLDKKILIPLLSGFITSLSSFLAMRTRKSPEKK